MPGFLRRLRRLGRAERREEVEGLLREALQRLDDAPAVASALARMGADGFVVVRYTFDEPDLEGADEAALQFTYHLADSLAGPGEAVRDEVRGSGLAGIDDEGVVRFTDVDAELYRLVRDEPPAE